MNLKDKLKGIVSLSAAAFALLQGTDDVKAKEVEMLVGRAGEEVKEKKAVSTEKLVLTSGQGNEVLYARGGGGSRGHSSHSSHTSHFSGSGSPSYSSPTYSTPRTPDYLAPSYNTPTAPAPSPVQPDNYPAPVKYDRDEMKAKIVASQKDRAAKGYPTAQYDLALRYLTGDGVEVDEKRAIQYLQMAAEQDHYEAIQKLKQLKSSGSTNFVATVLTTNPGQVANTNGTPLTPKKPYPVLLKEAAAGSPDAQYEVALCLLIGDGVVKDDQKAKTFLEMASIQGYSKAVQKLQEIQSAEAKK